MPACSRFMEDSGPLLRLLGRKLRRLGRPGGPDGAGQGKERALAGSQCAGLDSSMRAVYQLQRPVEVCAAVRIDFEVGASNLRYARHDTHLTVRFAINPQNPLVCVSE